MPLSRGLVGEGTCSLSLYPGSILFVHVCHPAVPYLSIGLAGCLVGPEISRGARKLARTPQVIYKKNSHSKKKKIHPRSD